VCIEWSREMLLEAWIDDAIACCEKCGVVPPSAVVPDRSLQPRDTDAGSAFSLPLPMPQFMVRRSVVLCVSVCIDSFICISCNLNNRSKDFVVV